MIQSIKGIKLLSFFKMYWLTSLFSRFKSNRECMGLMARKIKSKDIMTQSDLIEAVKSVKDEIDQEVIENCIKSMSGRINDCISINRDKVDY